MQQLLKYDTVSGCWSSRHKPGFLSVSVLNGFHCPSTRVLNCFDYKLILRDRPHPNTGGAGKGAAGGERAPARQKGARAAGGRDPPHGGLQVRPHIQYM